MKDRKPVQQPPRPQKTESDRLMPADVHPSSSGDPRLSHQGSKVRQVKQ